MGCCRRIRTTLRLKIVPERLRQILRFLPERGCVVDLGCGIGAFAATIAAARPDLSILGIEKDIRRLARARTMWAGTPNLSFIGDDIIAQSLMPADCFLLVDVLHHFASVGEQRLVVDKLARLLRPGGRLLLAEVCEQPRWKHLMSYVADRVLYPRDRIHYRAAHEWLALLEEVGLEAEAVPTSRGSIFASMLYVGESRNGPGAAIGR